jgi:hypothetical protein
MHFVAVASQTRMLAVAQLELSHTLEIACPASVQLYYHRDSGRRRRQQHSNDTDTMDQSAVYSLSLFSESHNEDGERSNQRVTKDLVDFILQFHLDDVFIYRDQIRENILSKQYYCDVDIAHLIAYNEELADRLNNEPAEIIPIVSKLWTSFVMFPDPVPV